MRARQGTLSPPERIERRDVKQSDHPLDRRFDADNCQLSASDRKGISPVTFCNSAMAAKPSPKRPRGGRSSSKQEAQLPHSVAELMKNVARPSGGR
jgi:hypothetical protein